MITKTLHIYFLRCLILFSCTVLAQSPFPTSTELGGFDNGPQNVDRPIILTSRNAANTPLTFNYCADADGNVEINTQDIESEVFGNSGQEDENNSAIYISTSNGDVIRVNHPYDGSSVEFICDLPFTGGATDIAINEDGELLVCSFDFIYKVDDDDCSYDSLYPNIIDEPNMNSLSFDLQGNLYVGLGSTSKVYRIDAGTSTAYVWHDFGFGSAGGDFVVLGDKMYVAWESSPNNYRLYEVEIDANTNYVSHVDLMPLPNSTYGLAREYGKLYALTKDALYEINVNNNTLNLILNNDEQYGLWYGAAGLHEAQSFSTEAYANLEDANNETNPLPEIWTNPLSGSQTIFIRITNNFTQEYETIPVKIIVGTPPPIVQPDDLIRCSDLSENMFDLSMVEDQLLANTLQDVTVSYFESLLALEEGLDAVSTNYLSDVPTKTLYVKVQNVDNDCYSHASFNVIAQTSPEVPALATTAEEQMLSNCYISKSNIGYFLLEEALELLHIDSNTNTVSFHATYLDAENNINALPNVYISSLGTVDEIFVRVTNALGCHAITNFFVDGDCVLSTLDLSNICFPKHMTPNGDGYFDYWNISGVSQGILQQTTIHIFDRYGKLLYAFNPLNSYGWDGTYNGTLLMPTDYWFTVALPNGMTFSGHFALVY